jgi:putative transposase
VELSAVIRAIHERSHHTYGARRVHAELREAYGVRIGRKRVARLMRQAGLKGVHKRRFRCTTQPGAPQRWAPDLVQRNFTADGPDELWVADATYSTPRRCRSPLHQGEAALEHVWNSWGL